MLLKMGSSSIGFIAFKTVILTILRVLRIALKCPKKFHGTPSISTTGIFSEFFPIFFSLCVTLSDLVDIISGCLPHRRIELKQLNQLNQKSGMGRGRRAEIRPERDIVNLDFAAERGPIHCLNMRKIGLNQNEKNIYNTDEKWQFQ